MAVFWAGIVLLLHDVSFQVQIATADQLVSKFCFAVS